MKGNKKQKTKRERKKKIFKKLEEPKKPDNGE